jgi:hypothetical protein
MKFHEEKIMSQQITDWVAQELATADEFYVPVKKLWVELRRRAEMPRLPLEEFTRLLENDERFEFEEGIDFGRASRRRCRTKSEPTWRTWASTAARGPS